MSAEREAVYEEFDAPTSSLHTQQMAGEIVALRARLTVQHELASGFEARACALDERLRETCQILVEGVGADGPCNAEDAAKRAVAQLAAAEQRAAIAEADRDECDRERRAVLADEAKLQHEWMTMMQERDDAKNWAEQAEGNIKELDASLLLLQRERDDARREARDLTNTIGFLSSVIKSGEAWSDECEKVLRHAFAKSRALDARGEAQG
jgi:chromosome segregation ATPase